MAPIIHLVRHAQGFHNLCVENQKLPDPDLTPLGITQCEELCKKFDAHDKITHLVASPIRRTLWTCLRSFDPVVKSGMKVIALPDAQEISNFPCDIGSEPEKLQKEFDDLVDLHLVQKGWNDKSTGSKYYPSPINLETRSREVRIFLRDLANKAGEDAQIVLVTHGGILHFLSQDWDDVNLERGTGWQNTEHRTYQFKDPTGQDPEACLKETQQSRRRRRGSVISLTMMEKVQIRQAYEALIDEITQENGNNKAIKSEEAVSV
ncbi:phosphoglycerate mutase-like protein [Annulohypoxylon maeteangense]|uniref:phosphoglycerate mutase-like protein n=1 Tax=Annulohypoxylon maeteangense TaxID=1927788 RepID=UPI002008CA53|nr:phosphoglycerate mutase-like protein [Annulohypoxylon maeteangense]KAI0888014.1 phosphoglycerate mutase-like protein [Annulohypoxylon maeteangense]